MPVEVVETRLAGAQAARLRGPAARAYQAFLDDLHQRGCAALSYRVTGPIPLERLCVKHLRGTDRVVVAFEGRARAWVLLVGTHRDDDPRRDFYDELYRLAGVRPPSDQRRRNHPAARMQTVLRRSMNRQSPNWWIARELSSQTTSEERGGRSAGRENRGENHGLAKAGHER